MMYLCFMQFSLVSSNKLVSRTKYEKKIISCVCDKWFRAGSFACSRAVRCCVMKAHKVLVKMAEEVKVLCHFGEWKIYPKARELFTWKNLYETFIKCTSGKFINLKKNLLGLVKNALTFSIRYRTSINFVFLWLHFHIFFRGVGERKKWNLFFRRKIYWRQRRLRTVQIACVPQELNDSLLQLKHTFSRSQNRNWNNKIMTIFVLQLRI